MVKAMNIKVGNPLTKLIFVKLADNANDEGVCRLSCQHIAEQFEISKDSVMSHILQLEKDGLLRREPRKKAVGVGCDLNVYNLNLQSPIIKFLI